MHPINQRIKRFPFAKALFLVTISSAGIGCALSAEEEAVPELSLEGAPAGASLIEEGSGKKLIYGFDALVPQTFRWGSNEYKLDNAIQEVHQGTDEFGPFMRYRASISVLVANRLDRANGTFLSWDLVLADGQRIPCTSSAGGFYLSAEGSERLTLDFFSEEQIDLSGSILQPYDGSLEESAPLQVPLDADLVTDPPVVVEELVSRVFQRQAGDSETAYEITVTSAEVNADSDLDLGHRAGPGKKYLDVQLHLGIVDATSSYDFGIGDVEVMSGGIVLSGIGGSSGSFELGHGREVRYLFELDESAREFSFSIRTASEQWESVDVVLPPVG